MSLKKPDRRAKKSNICNPISVMKQVLADVRSRSGANGEIARAKRSVTRQIILSVASLLLVIVLAVSMVMAWYTNVAQTGGISFKTEAWGFNNENITIGEEGVSYTASPGTDGIIPITINNSEGSSAITASVNVIKSEMSADMQKRIFFYADAAKTYSFGSGDDITEERADRIWLGSTEKESYSYEIAAFDKLVANSDYHSDTPIKWMWVYDCLGYYFRGTVSGGEVNISEYIRPIEYNPDEAEFSLSDSSADNYGDLVSIGEKTKAEFLAELFASDGYEGGLDLTAGEINPSAYVKVGKRIFYKIAVDENGSGVWAYLCSFAETEQNISYDNSLTGEEIITATVKITVANTSSEAKEVSNPTELLGAIEDYSGKIISLSTDMALNEKTEISENTDVKIDLCGHTLQYSGAESEYAAFTVPDSSSLSISGGSIVGNGKGSSSPASAKSIAVRSEGGRVTMSNVTVSDCDCAVYVSDVTLGSDSEVKIVGSNFTTSGTAVHVVGNGSQSDQATRVIIQDTTIVSDYIGISGQGNDSAGDRRWGTEIVLINDTVSGKWAAVYHPQQYSSLIISGCTLTGYTGIAVKGGSVRISSSNIIGTGAYASPVASGGGFSDTGDGIYLEASYPWPASIEVVGDENEISSTSGYAVELFGVSGAGMGSIKLCSGSQYKGGLASTNTNSIGSLIIE